MTSLTPTAAIAVAGVGLAAVSLVVAVIAVVKMNRLRRDYLLLAPRDDERSIVEVVARKTEEVRALRSEVDSLRVLLDRTRTELGDAIRHVSVVRYDAFADLGGRLSFSAALLDDGGDGMVLTSIQGRSETRQYLKGVRGGKSDTMLSPEELQAIEFAMGRRGR